MFSLDELSIMTWALYLTPRFVIVFKIYMDVFAQINKYSVFIIIYTSRAQDDYNSHSLNYRVSAY